jgi:hypothetical protein
MNFFEKLICVVSLAACDTVVIAMDYELSASSNNDGSEAGDEYISCVTMFNERQVPNYSHFVTVNHAEDDFKGQPLIREISFSMKSSRSADEFIKELKRRGKKRPIMSDNYRKHNGKIDIFNLHKRWAVREFTSFASTKILGIGSCAGMFDRAVIGSMLGIKEGEYGYVNFKYNEYSEKSEFDRPNEAFSDDDKKEEDFYINWVYHGVFEISNRNGKYNLKFCSRGAEDCFSILDIMTGERLNYPPFGSSGTIDIPSQTDLLMDQTNELLSRMSLLRIN